MQLVLVPVPLLMSSAVPPPSANAFAGEDWKPLLSPALEVTAACPLGLIQPVFALLGCVGVKVKVGVAVGVTVVVGFKAKLRTGWAISWAEFAVTLLPS